MEASELGKRMDNYIEDMDRQVLSIKEIMKDMKEMLSVYDTLPEILELKELISRNCLLIESKLSFYEFDSKRMKFLVKHKIKERIDLSFLLGKEKKEKRDIPSSSKGVQTIDLTSDQEDQKGKDFVFKPHTKQTSNFENVFQKLPTQQNPVEQQWFKMKELYNLENTDIRYVNSTGIYPRINYLQGSSPKEIRYSYDFGAINTIYLTLPDFPEISLLPKWVKDGVKDSYLYNSTITPNDVMVLKLFSAGPDFYKESIYPAYHFIIIEKVNIALSYNIHTKESKAFQSFNENDIHYRRALGIKIVINTLENAFKNDFRTYGGKNMYSSVMISSARRTPPATKKYLEDKIKFLDSGT